MKRLLIAFGLLLAGGRLATAQGTVPGTAGAPSPDCFFSSGSTGASSATGTFGPNGGSKGWFDNTNAQCAVWHLVYVATSDASSVSIELDGADLATNFQTPGAFSALTGAAPGSSNPSTAVGGADIAVAPVKIPAFVQVKIGTLNAGSVRWWVIGYRPNATTTPGTGFGSFVFNAPTGTFFAGQQAVTGTAAALASNTSKKFCVKALIGNTINVFVGITGVTTSTGDELTPGEGRCYTLSNTNLVFVVASTTGASVSFSGEN